MTKWCNYVKFLWNRIWIVDDAPPSDNSNECLLPAAEQIGYHSENEVRAEKKLGEIEDRPELLTYPQKAATEDLHKLCFDEKKGQWMENESLINLRDLQRCVNARADVMEPVRAVKELPGLGHQNSTLIAAFTLGWTRVLEVLLSTPLSIDWTRKNEKGFTPLHATVRSKDDCLVRTNILFVLQRLRQRPGLDTLDWSCESVSRDEMASIAAGWGQLHTLMAVVREVGEESAVEYFLSKPEKILLTKPVMWSDWKKLRPEDQDRFDNESGFND